MPLENCEFGENLGLGLGGFLTEVVIMDRLPEISKPKRRSYSSNMSDAQWRFLFH